MARIPSHRDQPSFNLSHAVAVCCYALGRGQGRDPAGARSPATSPEEVRRFLSAMETFLESIEFSPDDGSQGRNARSRLRRFLIRAAPGRTELNLLWKMLRRVEWRLREKNGTLQESEPEGTP